MNFRPVLLQLNPVNWKWLYNIRHTHTPILLMHLLIVLRSMRSKWYALHAQMSDFQLGYMLMLWCTLNILQTRAWDNGLIWIVQDLDILLRDLTRRWIFSRLATPSLHLILETWLKITPTKSWAADSSLLQLWWNNTLTFKKRTT